MVNQKLTRRQFVGGSLGASLLANVRIESEARDEMAVGSKYKLFWGDLHNHNAVGYAKGSLERSFRIARSLLDFYAFTPHSYWHDMPKVSEATFNKFHNGFKTTKERWPDVLKKCAEYHEAGKFVTFPGYEWHSSRYGDYCLIFPYDNAPLKTFNNLESLQKFAREKGIIVIPHHPANRRGNRGANFETLRTNVSPVLEIYSEWGGSRGRGSVEVEPQQPVADSEKGCLFSASASKMHALRTLGKVIVQRQTCTHRFNSVNMHRLNLVRMIVFRNFKECS